MTARVDLVVDARPCCAQLVDASGQDARGNGIVGLPAGDRHRAGNRFSANLAPQTACPPSECPMATHAEANPGSAVRAAGAAKMMSWALAVFHRYSCWPPAPSPE
jgi:hypothetical protein